jgi:hypothetical protein
MKPLLIAAALISSTLAGLAAGAPAQAYERERTTFWRHGTATPVIDQRQAEQAFQIERGRRRGALTWLEYRRLKNEQARIATQEARAKADGRVDRFERRALWRAQERAQLNISAAVNNNARRWGWWSRRTSL